MTEEQFRSRAFKHSMLLRYHNKRDGEHWDCLLIAVDFDKEVICLWPLPDAEFEFNVGKEFWVSYELVEFPPKQYLKTVK